MKDFEKPKESSTTSRCNIPTKILHVNYLNTVHQHLIQRLNTEQVITFAHYGHCFKESSINFPRSLIN